MSSDEQAWTTPPAASAEVPADVPTTAPATGPATDPADPVVTQDPIEADVCLSFINV